jgi:hypothetical protein
VIRDMVKLSHKTDHLHRPARKHFAISMAPWFSSELSDSANSFMHTHTTQGFFRNIPPPPCCTPHVRHPPLAHSSITLKHHRGRDRQTDRQILRCSYPEVRACVLPEGERQAGHRLAVQVVDAEDQPLQ